MSSTIEANLIKILENIVDTKILAVLALLTVGLIVLLDEFEPNTNFNNYNYFAI